MNNICMSQAVGPHSTSNLLEPFIPDGELKYRKQIEIEEYGVGNLE